MKTVKYVVLVIWTICCSVFCYPEYGFSGYLASKQEIPAEEWYKIHSWSTSPQKIWQYSENTKFDDSKSNIIITKSGLYFVSFNIDIITNSDTGVTIHASVVVNDKYVGNTKNNKPIQSLSTLHFNEFVKASGFVYVQIGDTLSVCINSNSEIQAAKQSGLYMRYQDSYSALPGFLFSVSNKIIHNQDQLILGPWKNQHEGQFESSSSFRQDLSQFQIPNTGVYMFCLNLIGKLTQEKQVSLQFLVNGIVKTYFKIFYQSNSMFTTNFNDMVFLKSTDVVEIEVVVLGGQLEIFEETTFSMVLIKPDSTSANGFRGELLETYHSTEISSPYTLLKHWKPSANRSIDFQSLSESTIVDSTSFSVEDASGRGVYYVSTNLMVTLKYDEDVEIHGKFIDVVFYGVDLFQSKRIHVFNGSVSKLAYDDDVLSYEFSINLIGSMLLSTPTPIGVGIKAEGSKMIIFHRESSFSVLQSSEPYPGMHGALKENLPQSSIQQITPTGWINSIYEGFYDFTNSFNVTNGVFTAESDGIYLVTTNLVCEDVDNRLTLLISKDRSRSITDGFHAKDSDPVQSIGLNTGGFMSLKHGSNISLLVQAEDDQDWEVALGGLSITYIGENPLYFQARLDDDLVIPKIDDVNKNIITTWRESHGKGFSLNHGKIILSYTGIYYTIGTIIVDDAANSGSESYYKTHLKMNGSYIKGIYGKRKIGLESLPIGKKSYTLFFSGSFYGEKESKMSVELETGNDVGFTIISGSSWGMFYLREKDDLSGCLAIFDKDVQFMSNNDIWRSLNFDFPGSTTSSDGRYERSNKVSFGPSVVTVQSTGVYLISLNIEVEYTRNEKTIFKLRVFVNENEGDANGMTTWKQSKWDSETIHITGAMFFNSGDRIEIKFKCDAIGDTKVLVDSGFSLVKITESDQSGSFASILNEDLNLGYEEAAISNLQFSGPLRSLAINKQEGTIDVPYSGYHIISSNVVVQNHNEAEGVVIGVKVNGKNVRTYDHKIQNGTAKVIQIQEILELHLSDIVEITTEPMYDTVALSDAYETYLVKTNNTAPGNSTVSNPYHALNLTIIGDSASMSLLYVQSFFKLTGWWAELISDYQPLVSNVDVYHVITPWSMPTSLSNSGEAKLLIEKTGVYFLMANVMVHDVKELTAVSFVSSHGDAVKCNVKFECGSSCQQNFIMNCVTMLTKGGNVGIYIKTKTTSGLTIMKPSSRAINFFGESISGFAMTSLTDSISLVNNDWTPLGKWSAESNDYIHGLFYQDISMYHEEIVLHEGGTYEVSVNLMFQIIALCVQNCKAYIKAALFINDVMEKSLYRNIMLDPNLKTMTLNMLGGIHIKKWDRIILKLNAPSTVQLTLKPGSTFAVVHTEPVHEHVTDKGPIMISKLNPNSYETHVMGIKKEWVCQAFADGPVTYTWYKDGQVYEIQRNATGILLIAGYINDTATFICEAEYAGLKVRSNTLAIRIYDINECRENGKNDCSEFADCTNTPGSYKCTCKKGYSGDGLVCADTNECHSSPCVLNANCTDLPGPDFECYCYDGFKGDPYENCTDVDECHSHFGKNDCHKERAECINYQGGYNCSCFFGWSGNGSNGINCTDLNECEVGNYTCDVNAECYNLNGTYGCLCNAGFTGSGVVCDDIKECSTPHEVQNSNDYKCVENSECVNIVGGYGCNCKKGFTGNGTEECFDIDECLGKPCNADADCKNIPGSYDCDCRPGYHGDGFQCSDLDECATGKHSCGSHGNCSNTIGSYTCMCKIGYRLNANTCEEDPAQKAAITDECIIDPKSYGCLCRDPETREDNIMCNGLFVALVILCAVALVVLILLWKYLKSRKLMKIKPAKFHRDKYIEMENESEI